MYYLADSIKIIYPYTNVNVDKFHCALSSIIIYKVHPVALSMGGLLHKAVELVVGANKAKPNAPLWLVAPQSHVDSKATWRRENTG